MIVVISYSQTSFFIFLIQVSFDVDDFFNGELVDLVLHHAVQIEHLASRLDEVLVFGTTHCLSQKGVSVIFIVSAADNATGCS